MNHDFAFGIEVNPCVIEITIGNAKLSSQKQKSLLNFSKIAGLGGAHKIFRYNNLSGANSHAVCVLAHSLKNRRQPFIKEMINFSLYIEWLSCCYRTFKG